MPSERHTVYLPDGSRVEVTRDRYEVHLAKPLVFHRKHWIIPFRSDEEVRRTVWPGDFDPFTKALEAAFKTVQQVIYRDGDHDAE